MTSQRSSGGYTITEVLIVLAIAGLIFLIVFQAIPTLERSSRNNQRRQDVQSILAAVSHYELNNSANFPLSTDTNFGDFQTLLGDAKLSYYQPTSPGAITTQSGTYGASITYKNTTDTEHVDLYNYAKCDFGDASNPGGAIDNGAGYGDDVALFSVETAGGNTPQCEQL